MSAYIEQIRNVVVNGQYDDIETLVTAALEDGAPPLQVLNQALIAAMDVVGQRFLDCQIYLPELLISAHTMKKGLAVIQPLLKGGKTRSQGTILMATVKGDLHDIGKNIVAMMLEGAGFRVIDLGVDVSVEKIMQQLEEQRPDVLGLSALLTTTMPEMKQVIDALKTRGIRGSVKVLVGGAPIDAEFAKEVGADGYAPTAVEAVAQVRGLLSIS